MLNFKHGSTSGNFSVFNSNQINEIKFICDTKIQTAMKEVKQKVMCQQDTEAAKSCTNRCSNGKKLNIKTMAIH